MVTLGVMSLHLLQDELINLCGVVADRAIVASGVGAGEIGVLWVEAGFGIEVE